MSNLVECCSDSERKFELSIELRRLDDGIITAGEGSALICVMSSESQPRLRRLWKHYKGSWSISDVSRAG